MSIQIAGGKKAGKVKFGDSHGPSPGPRIEASKPQMDVRLEQSTGRAQDRGETLAAPGTMPGWRRIPHQDTVLCGSKGRPHAEGHGEEARRTPDYREGRHSTETAGRTQRVSC